MASRKANMDFTNFDQRQYPTVTPKVGYAEWANTYEASVPGLLDIGILERIHSIRWPETRQCLDLACGTGRTGSWLAAKGVSQIDGVDFTPEMLTQAGMRKVYRRLQEASVENTGLPGATYDLLIMSLADEHLARLEPTYLEASRLSSDNAKFVVVGMHPFMFLTGMPTHFNDQQGQPKAIETHIHLFSDHFAAATTGGWRLREAVEGLIDDRWLEVKPKWKPLRGTPVNYGYVWAREL